MEPLRRELMVGHWVNVLEYAPQSVRHAIIRVRFSVEESLWHWGKNGALTMDEMMERTRR